MSAMDNWRQEDIVYIAPGVLACRENCPHACCNPEQHHEDCDFRNSSAAKEAAETLGLDEEHEVFPCNLGCNDT